MINTKKKMKITLQFCISLTNRIIKLSSYTLENDATISTNMLDERATRTLEKYSRAYIEGVKGYRSILWDSVRLDDLVYALNQVLDRQPFEHCQPPTTFKEYLNVYWNMSEFRLQKLRVCIKIYRVFYPPRSSL